MKSELHNAVIGGFPHSGNSAARDSTYSPCLLIMSFAGIPEVTNVDTPTRIRPGTVAQWEKQCPKCDEWVGLGKKGSLHTFLVHQDGQRCFRAAERKTRARKEEALPFPVLSASVGHPTLSPPPVSTYPDVTMSELDPSSSNQPTFPDPNISPTSTLSLFPPSTVPSPALPEQLPCISPTISDAVASNAPQITPPQIPTMYKVPCLGVRLKWVCERPARTYPFQYHDTGNLPWLATVAGPYDLDYIYLRSTSCHQFRDPFLTACSECIGVPSSTKFQSLVQRALKDPALSTSHIFLPWEQLSHKLRNKTDECRQLRKKVCLPSRPQLLC